jgi:hypothetical protein
VVIGGAMVLVGYSACFLVGTLYRKCEVEEEKGRGARRTAQLNRIEVVSRRKRGAENKLMQLRRRYSAAKSAGEGSL